MEDSYTTKRIRKCNRKFIIWGILVLIISLIILLLSIPYYGDFFTGPHIRTGAEIATDVEDDYLDHFFVTILTTGLYESGYYTTSTDDDGNEYTDTLYYIADTGGGYLIVIEGEPDETAMIFTGEIFWMSSTGFNDVQKAVSQIDSISGKTLLPVMMEQGNFRLRGYIGIFLLALFIFLSVTMIVMGVKNRKVSEGQPCVKDLSRLGPLEFVTSRIDSEMSFPHETIGKLHFLNSMALQETKSGFEVMRYEDVVWAYKSAMTAKNLGMFLQTNYSLVINDRYIKTLCLTDKRDVINKMMNLLMRRIPFAYKGYSDEINNVWWVNPQALVRGMEDRKNSVVEQHDSIAPPDIPDVP